LDLPGTGVLTHAFSSGDGGWSGTDETADRRDGLVDLGLRGVVVARARGIDHAMVQVVLDQGEGDGAQRRGHRRDLGEDVDAVLLLVDHALQAAGLALDPAQSLEQVGLLLDVAVRGRLRCVFHTTDYTPKGYGSVPGRRLDPEDLVDLLGREAFFGLAGSDDQVGGQLHLTHQLAVLQRNVELISHPLCLPDPQTLARRPIPCRGACD